MLDEVVAGVLDGRDEIELDRLAALPPALARLVVRRLAEDAAGARRAAGGAPHRGRAGAGPSDGALDLGTAHARAYARGSCRLRRSADAAAPPSGADLHVAAVRATPPIGEILVQRRRAAAPRRASSATEISRDYAGKDLLLVGVLKGAVFFLSDLMRHIDDPVRGRLHGGRLLRLGDRLQRASCASSRTSTRRSKAATC